MPASAGAHGSKAPASHTFVLDLLRQHAVEKKKQHGEMRKMAKIAILCSVAIVAILLRLTSSSEDINLDHSPSSIARSATHTTAVAEPAMGTAPQPNKTVAASAGVSARVVDAISTHAMARSAGRLSPPERSAPDIGGKPDVPSETVTDSPTATVRASGKYGSQMHKYGIYTEFQYSTVRLSRPYSVFMSVFRPYFHGKYRSLYFLEAYPQPSIFTVLDF